jgi:hypothetical protein
MSSGLPSKADMARCSRHVSQVPKHEVAALQPAAREQEQRGRQPVERTAMAGGKVNTISSCIVGVQRMIKNSKDHLAGRHPDAASHIDPAITQ